MDCSPVAPRVLHRGWLLKRSPREFLGIRVDQRRYFVLTAAADSTGRQRASLVWYKSANDSPLGAIEVRDIHAVTPSQSAACVLAIALTNTARVYHLTASSALEFSQWFAALRRAQRDDGQVRLATPSMDMARLMSAASTTKSQRSSLSLSSASPSSSITVASPLSTSVDLLLSGCCVSVVSEGLDGSVHFASTVLRWDPHAGSLGALEWQTSDADGHAVNHRLPLDSVRELFLGRRSRAFSLSEIALKAVRADCCFSAVGRARDSLIALHVCGEHVEVVSAILTGIQSLMERGTKRVTVQRQRGSIQDIFSNDTEAAVSVSNTLITTTTSPSVELVQWLSSLGSAYNQYCESFFANGVDCALMCQLDDEDLVELGVHSAVHRKKLIAESRKQNSHAHTQPARELASAEADRWSLSEAKH